MKYKYEELSPELKKNLLNKLTARLIFEGKADPERTALIFLLSCKSKSKKRWKTLKNRYGRSIKKHRIKLGFKPN